MAGSTKFQIMKDEKEEKEHPENQQAEAENQETEQTSEGNDGSDQNEDSEPREETDDFEVKYNEANDKYLRLYSDFENFRRRSAKERLELVNSAGGDILKSILPVLDDFERALNADKENKDAQAIKEGITLVYQKLMKTLKEKGLTEMKNMGETFDAEREEAIAKIPAPKKKLKGKVVDVVEKGYYLNDKILRHAKVVVGE